MIKLSSLINEVEVGQGHENDRDMVVGVAEILRMVDDMNNRKEIADAMLRKFKSEDVIHNAGEFLTLCGLNSVNEENEPTNPKLWDRAIAAAKAKYDVYPSAYANAFASKWYKEKGGDWRTKKESVDKNNNVETKLDEDLTYGYKHILHLIPTGYSPNNPKYKKDLSDLRDLLNRFYDTHGYDIRIRNTF